MVEHKQEAKSGHSQEQNKNNILEPEVTGSKLGLGAEVAVSARAFPVGVVGV